MNIKEAITLYLSYKESLGEKIRGVRYFLLRFERYINPIVDLDEIKETDCQNFLNSTGRKSNSYTRYWDDQFCKLERFFVWAFSRNFIHSIPLPKIRPTIRHDFTPYIYSPDELNKIFATALCYRRRYNIEYPYVIQTMLKLTYCLGLRSGETTRLLVEDIDLNNDMLYINETKFHKSRLVTANAPVMKMLKSYLEWRRNLVKEYHFVDNHLFLDKRGNGVPQHELQQAFRLICTKANIVHKDGKNVRLHDLRHIKFSSLLKFKHLQIFAA